MKARNPRSEDGFTLVEAVIAALLLVTGALATLQVFDTATRTNYRAEESQTVNDRLQAELEQIQDLPYSQLALSSLPGSSGSQLDPRSRVSGTTFAVSKSGTGAAPLVVDAQQGAVSSTPESFHVGDISGQIFKFITWRNDPSCPEAQCPGQQDLKHVVVAAKVDAAPISFPRTYQEVHTDVADPEATPVNNPAPPGTGQPITTQFWLTDTPCSFATRQPIVADHLTHNTRSRCSDGLHTGSTQGAPDLMFTEAPALDTNYSPSAQPMYDYATDSEPSTNADQDRGLLMPWSSSDSCLLQPVLDLLNLHKLLEGLLLGVNLGTTGVDGILNMVTGETNKHFRTHTWVSPKITNPSGVLMTGDANLSLWTKTINGAIHPGKICVWMFVRQTITVPLLSLLGIPIGNINLTVDIPVVNIDPLLPHPTYFEYSQNPWPAQWSEVSVPMHFLAVNSAGVLQPLNLTQGSQLGVTIMVKKTGTNPGQGLEFMYDHPSFESRLEVQTQNILSFGGT